MSSGVGPEDRAPIVHALECKVWWAQKILRGEKTVEVRQYELPEHLLGVPIWLAATSGADGQAALGDCVTAGQAGGELVGWVTFDSIHKYTAAAEFQADEHRHCVNRDSLYAWKEGQGLYGWQVGSCQAVLEPESLPSMQRLHRSLYKLDRTMPQRR